MNKMHAANRASWNDSAAWWQAREDKRGLWQRCSQDPTLVLSPTEMSFLKNIQGQEVAVLGSGDNEVVFALAGLGAHVTSVDIAEKRLEIAAERAAILGLDVSFLRADITELADLADNTFDLVYTGGHMSVWISNIAKYYAESVRILRPGGTFMVNEYHPIRRMWLDSTGPLPRHSYFNRGPYQYQSDDGLPTFEYHWTVADHIQAVLDAGCALLQVEEYGEEVPDEDWMQVELKKFPAYLLIVGRKLAAKQA